ncbi:MAG: protein arginine kinase [Phycisphaeraceae bacterium]|nr:MAG: protein arginine kinase [Phycisphaeraceae bacterium]
MRPGPDESGPAWDKSHLPVLCAKRTEWLRGGGESCDVVMSSRVRLARNLAGFPFMPKAERADREQILELCRRQIVAARLAPQHMWVDLHSASKAERSLLVERQLISRPHATGKLSSGKGGAGEPRAVAVGLPDEQLAVSVNEEDHIRIQVIRTGLDLAEAYRRADKADDALESGLEFAFSPVFGYLTACPTNVGTGARFSVMLHLPALKMTGEIEKVKNAADDMGLAVRGFYGEGSDAAGDFFQLSNQITLGKSEQRLLEIMQDEIVPMVVEYERRARDALLGRRRRATEDTIFRALGVLENARLLSVEEAMNLLSRVRLGVTLRLLTDIDPDTVCHLFLLVQNAHLERTCERGTEPIDRNAVRADLLRSRLHARPG